jgi:diaminopimelate decarboxylase
VRKQRLVGYDRDLNVQQGDLIAALPAGARCRVMASNYNTRGRAKQVMVDGAKASAIRQRETAAAQVRLEIPL